MSLPFFARCNQEYFPFLIFSLRMYFSCPRLQVLELAEIQVLEQMESVLQVKDGTLNRKSVGNSA